MEAAVHCFARHGFDGTSIKDITERAGVNPSLVSYHFNGKEGLYLACIESFGRSRLEMARKLLVPPSSQEELRIRLTMFVEEWMGCQMDQPDICRVIYRECDLEFPVAPDVFRDLFLESFKTLQEFFRRSQATGFIHPDRDVLAMSGFLMGSMMHMARNDYVSKKFFNVSLKDSDYRTRVVGELVTQFLEGNGPSDMPRPQISAQSQTSVHQKGRI